MPPGGDLNIVARFAGDIVIHEGWNRSLLLHDIALVRFEVAVPLSGKWLFNQMKLGHLFILILTDSNSIDSAYASFGIKTIL